MVQSRKIRVRLAGLVLAGAILLGVGLPVPAISAQDDEIQELLSISVRAGYDGRFRPGRWVPMRVTVENRGLGITGKFVVRPETSGSGIPNVFSVPVDLPANTSQSLFIYIVARNNADTVRVDLLDESGNILASRDTQMRALRPRDNLYALVTDAANPRINLIGLTIGGYDAYQATWSVENVPDKAPALTALDAMIYSEVDTGALTPAQQRAITSWVIGGGHLIVTGGPNWESTAAGLTDLLPLSPTGSESSTDMTALVRLGGDYTTNFTDEFILATGDLVDEAWVLAANEDGIPLVARRALGNGVVDYVAVDPGSGQLRDWEGLPQLWRMLVTSVNVNPSWSYGIADWQELTTASEILPGVNLLPAALSLTGFLLAYILLVGPLNYLILNRLNRREYAWFTIPVLIVIFTVLAWSLGFQLRGEDVTLSRVSVVQTWPDAEDAKLNQVIGLLAPRRGDYNLTMPDDRMLRPISDDVATSIGPASRALTSIEIQQTSQFSAVEFPVDASFMASFQADGMTPRPDIGGRVSIDRDRDGTTIDRDRESGQRLIYAEGDIRALQGVVTNRSDLVLEDAVILGRNRVLRLAEPLAPGAVFTFNLADFEAAAVEEKRDNESLKEFGAAPVPQEFTIASDNPFFTTRTTGFRGSLSAYRGEASRSVQEILGPDNYQGSNFGISVDDDARTQELRRRQAFLSSFMVDQYLSTARGDRMYLIGWTRDATTEEEVSGNTYDVIDTTLYIIELEVEENLVGSGEVTVGADRFSWVSLERFGQSDVGPASTRFYTDVDLTFQFTPLPDAVLSEVTGLTVIIDRVRNARGSGFFELWNWRTETWEVVDLPLEEYLDIPNPEPYIGPQNAVRIRVSEVGLGNAFYLELLAVEQRGRY
jgi:hypothetical protein